jgi:Cdc6-like AAA superfamily ATPase
MSSNITVNPHVLSHDFVPDKLLHREKELAELSATLGFVNSFVYGNAGIGKTLLARKIIENSISTKGTRAVYIDASLYQTTNAVFTEILTSLGNIVTSKSNYDLTKRLQAKLRHLDCRVTVCVDHLERLKEIETLDRILSLGLKLMIIAESKESYRRLSPQARAQITNLVGIPTYSSDQVFDILQERTKEALAEYTYSEETIRKMADLSQGNVTLALNLLKSLVLKAESEGKSSIDKVELNYEVDCPDDNLSRDERILLKILEEWKSLPSSRLFAFYREKAHYPKGERSFRSYMKNLCLQGLVKNVGDKRGRVYEIVEQTR